MPIGFAHGFLTLEADCEVVYKCSDFYAPDYEDGDRPGHDMRYAIDASRIQNELDWEPVETFEAGIRKTVEWYLANESWWRPIVAERQADQRRELAA